MNVSEPYMDDKSTLVSGNGLKLQTITCANVHPDLCGHIASISSDKPQRFQLFPSLVHGNLYDGEAPCHSWSLLKKFPVSSTFLFCQPFGYNTMSVRIKSKSNPIGWFTGRHNETQAFWSTIISAMLHLQCVGRGLGTACQRKLCYVVKSTFWNLAQRLIFSSNLKMSLRLLFK